ncbi:Triosephosphate isomerase [uncultured Alphaproteobacteria bacterium]|uniref:Triosephosphate isomerase n=1 Tax=uncultured Alphaproteobacteria bacterium TaxID=91750 RepID=A0A212J7T5_9PROT|nr:Triosephosphate isomerase [uncultured Alphaproteobacteria bacterium]
MDQRRPLIAGNWKMNGLVADGVALAEGLAALARPNGDLPPDAAAEVPPDVSAALPCDILVCPPFTLVDRVAQTLAGTRIAVGGQDCHAAVSGAHTGDVSAEMLKDLGCRYVIVGHSERRADHLETDRTVRDKAEAGLRAGLIAIVCVGETEVERDAGQTEAVVARQIAGSVPSAATPETVVIAYEPVWAIGTGKTATPAEAQAVHARIRTELDALLGSATAARMRILYGGSVKPGNAAELLGQPDIDGALVGGASLKASDFWGIVRAAK